MRKHTVFLFLVMIAVSACLSAEAQGFGAMIGFPGDPTLDGAVDVRDVQAGVSQALGASTQLPEADINNDGQIDVRDVQQLVNSALQDGGVYQLVKGTVQSDCLDNLRLLAVSDSGLTAESPVDAVTGAFTLSLRVKAAWMLSVVDSQAGGVRTVFQFSFGDTQSKTLPIFDLSDGTAWDLGVIRVSAEGVSTASVDLGNVIDLTRAGLTEGNAPVIQGFSGEVPGIPASVDKIYAYLIDLLARKTAWAIQAQEEVPGTGSGDTDEAVRLVPLSGRFGYGIEGPYGLTGSLTKEELTDADWCLEANFAFPTSGYTVGEPEIRAAQTYPEKVWITITVTPPAPDLAVAQMITPIQVTALITASNEAAFGIQVITSGSTDPDPQPDLMILLQSLLDKDPNHDGSVTLEEAMTLLPGLANEVFTGMDTNGDDCLTQDDLTVSSEPQTLLAQGDPTIILPEPEPPMPPAPFGLTESLLAKDPDHDGSVTFDEASALLPGLGYDTFKGMDTNRDGSLTQDDLSDVVTGNPGAELPAYLSEAAIADLAAAIVACADTDGALDSPVEYSLADADANGVPDMFQSTVDCLFTVLPDWLAKYSVPALADANANGRADVIERNAAVAVSDTVRMLADVGLLGCHDLDANGVPDCIRPYVTDGGAVPVPDSDSDGVPDWAEDDNGNGIPNIKDPASASVVDLDGDGVPNTDDADIDGDGVPNYCDADPRDANNAEVAVPSSGVVDGQAGTAVVGLKTGKA
jgi:hypothetical protein